MGEVSHFTAGTERTIVLLEGSQASSARLSVKSIVKVVAWDSGRGVLMREKRKKQSGKVVRDITFEGGKKLYLRF
jgi:hypothetical protein